MLDRAATIRVAKHGEIGPIRRVAASGLVALGVLAALFGGVFRYVDDHFHDPDNFLANTETLADNAEVRERLFNGFRTEIIALADGVDLDEVDAPLEDDDNEAANESDDEDAADDEAGEGDVVEPITDARIERDTAIEEILLNAFDSDLYGELFDEQLGSVQSQLIRAADLPDEALLRDPGQVNFDARGLYPSIYEALAADERTAEITQNAVPDTYGIYAIADRETTVNAGWWLVENGPNWRGLASALAILSFIGMVVVAERRPTRVIQFGLGMVGLALVIVVAAYILRAIVPLLANGDGGSGSVVAVYAANTDPLVSIMWRLMIIGVVLSVLGAIARLIWPDDWVYGHVSDDRGVRSIRRRRGTPEAQPAQPQQQPVAAAVPVGYPQAPYPYAPQGWGAPYPGQPYGMPYGGYPAGPYAQPGPMAVPQHTGQPTVPVTIVHADAASETITGENPVVQGNGQHGQPSRPSDAAQAVPRVVAQAPEVAPPAPAEAAQPPAADPRATVADPSGQPSPVADSEPRVVSPPADGDDEWASDGDW